MPTLWIVLFLVIFAFMLIGTAVGLRALESRHKSVVEKVLRNIEPGGFVQSHPLDLLEQPEAEPQLFGYRLRALRFYRHLEDLLKGAGMSASPELLLTIMASGALAGALLGLFVNVLVFRELSMIALAALGAILPFAFVSHRRARRLREFESQFPEALDFVARALRSGHAFSVSIELLAAESPEPVRTEFRKVFHEMNLGAPMERALGGLADRIPLVDVRFFVSTVLLQRETGGNLAEILTKLGLIIRERFRLKGQVRALSAHGRLTALILTIMPIALTVGMSIVAPSYLDGLVKDQHGRWMIVFAIGGQVVGYLLMRRIINIRV
ncbi:MAG: type II secretion system F family protein [Bryobacter sp.]|nr:type II secretion system F family protein [Bryobacter sp.]